MSITGYNYAWEYLNQDYSRGSLTANVNFAAIDGTSLHSKNWSLGSTGTSGWTSINGTESFNSSLAGATSYVVTDAVKVQALATNLKNGTGTSQVINSVTWIVGCCTCRAGGSNPNAVEFSNIGSCSGSSTAALRPWINNANWGGIGSTVNAATQTLTLTFS